MKLLYLGTAAAEGWPAPFCQCDNCKAARIKREKISAAARRYSSTMTC